MYFSETYLKLYSSIFDLHIESLNVCALIVIRQEALELYCTELPKQQMLLM